MDLKFTNTADRLIFYSCLATMTRAGIQFDRALQALVDTADEDGKPETLEVTRFLHEKIFTGSKISDSVRATGHAFPRYAAGTLKAAEESGKMDDALLFLSEVEEKELKLKKKLRHTLSYPLWVGAVAMLIVIVLAWFIRGLSDVFEGIGAQMPVYLRFMVNVADYLFTPWPLLSVIFVGFLFYRKFRDPKFRRTLRNRTKDLGLPIFSRVMVLTANIHFCRLLAMQLDAGCSLLPALSRALKGSDDDALVDEADPNRKPSIVWKIINGVELSKALQQSGYFTEHLVSMLRIAEESGSVPKTLMSVADFLQSELDYRFDQFTSLVQPVFMVVLGSGVALVAVGTFLPLIEVMNL